jgi:hypothetical protein
MPAKINTFAPPDWLGDVICHPILKLDTKMNEVGRSAAGSIGAATDALYEAFGAVEEVSRKLTSASVDRMNPGQPRPPGRLVGNKFVPDHGHERELAAKAKKHFDNASAAYEAGMQRGRAAREALARRVAKALEPDSSQPHVDSEVRTHVRELPITKRTPFIFELVSSGEKRSVAAILHAPPYLSGLDQQDMRELHARAATKFAGDDYENLVAVEEALARAEAVGGSFVDRMRPHLMPVTTKKNEAAAALEALGGSS